MIVTFIAATIALALGFALLLCKPESPKHTIAVRIAGVVCIAAAVASFVNMTT